MLTLQTDDAAVEFIYCYVGVAVVDEKITIVTGQCAGKSAAIRQAFSYCDEHDIDRSTVRVCELKPVSVDSATGLDPMNRRGI